MVTKVKCIKCDYKRTKEQLDRTELSEFKARMDVEILKETCHKILEKNIKLEKSYAEVRELNNYLRKDEQYAIDIAEKLDRVAEDAINLAKKQTVNSNDEVLEITKEIFRLKISFLCEALEFYAENGIPLVGFNSGEIAQVALSVVDDDDRNPRRELKGVKR